MLVRDARLQAKEWLDREARGLSGVLGAYLTGSTKWKRADAVHAESSDVDMRIVVEEPAPPRTWSKSRFRDVLIEAALVPLSDLGTAEALLANPYLAGSLWHPRWLAGPRGELAGLARRITAEFPRRGWVERRGEAVRDLALHWLGGIDQAPSFPAQVTTWLFGTGVTTYILLTAGLRNLTVKRRYAESRALLAQHGRLELHEEMLAWLGCAALPADRVRSHLEALATAFDAIGPHVDPSFRFAADLQPASRPVAIRGCGELVDEGLHREAVFWLVATFSRCLQGLAGDAPEGVRRLCEAGFRRVLEDLGVRTRTDLQARAVRVRESLPLVDAAAEAIRDATPEIIPD